MKNWQAENDDSIVCYCLNVNKKTIVDAIKSGAASLTDIKRTTGACTGGNCKTMNPSGKCCSGDIAALIKIYGDVDNEDSKNGCCCCK